MASLMAYGGAVIMLCMFVTVMSYVLFKTGVSLIKSTFKKESFPEPVFEDAFEVMRLATENRDKMLTDRNSINSGSAKIGGVPGQ